MRDNEQKAKMWGAVFAVVSCVLLLGAVVWAFVDFFSFLKVFGILFGIVFLVGCGICIWDWAAKWLEEIFDEIEVEKRRKKIAEEDRFDVF